MALIEVLLCALGAVLLVPTFTILVQVVMAIRQYKSTELSHADRPGVVVVVPAHDESLVIGQTLGSIRAQLIRADRLLVVADNCTDDTAQIARACGAQVIERVDPSRWGKAYALDYAIRHLESDPPEVVIFIDADCQLASGTIDRLARVCANAVRPIQARYLMSPPAAATVILRVAQFAWLIKNYLRPLGYKRLGLPCQLMGTGMAFPWAVISTTHFASEEIVEDLSLGITLAAAGKAPLFCPEALVTSIFPTSADGIWAQRTRWEHGHLGVIVERALPLIKEAIWRTNLDILALILDVCVPPLSLLVLLILGTCAASIGFAVLTSRTLPLLVASSALSLLLSGLFLAWVTHGRSVIGLTEIAWAPLYTIRKIPLYARFIFRRQARWVRAKRDEL